MERTERNNWLKKACWCGEQVVFKVGTGPRLTGLRSMWTLVREVSSQNTKGHGFLASIKESE